MEMEMLRKGVSERCWWWCELEEWRFCNLQVVAGRNQETLGKREGGAFIPRVPVGLRLGADGLGERGDIKVLGHVGGAEFRRKGELAVSEGARGFDRSFQIRPSFCPKGFCSGGEDQLWSGRPEPFFVHVFGICVWNLEKQLVHCMIHFDVVCWAA